MFPGGKDSRLTSVVRSPGCLHIVVSGVAVCLLPCVLFFIRRCGGEGKEVVHVWYRGSARLRVKSVRAGLNNGRKCVSLRHGVGGPASLLPLFLSDVVEGKGRKCSGYYLFAFAFLLANRGAQTLKMRALACAAMPSARPVKPSFSVVVAFMLTRSSGSERSAATLARICGM